jgi:8-oxo-dGTP pyrophosphatase MutT (NUDIX family)
MEETTEVGAVRETWEEAQARISIDRLLAVYNVPRLSQVQTIYRATLLSPDIAPGEESLEVGLFAWEDIPWEEIAFPTVRWALHQHRSVIGQDDFAPFGNPSGDRADYF